MHISFNLHFYQVFLYTTTTNSNIATCVSEKKMEKAIMDSDVEHFSLWKDYAYKVMFKFKKCHTAYFR